MAIVTRVSRLFQADFHAVLDHLEEPEVLLRQAVREMEDALAGDRQQMKLLEHEVSTLHRREETLERRLAVADRELDLCLDAGKDDLARSLVRRKLETRQLFEALGQRRELLERSVTDMASRISGNQARLTQMLQKLEILSEEPARDGLDSAWSEPDLSVREADIEVALLREKQRRAKP